MHHSARRLLLPLVAVAVASLLAATATAAYHGGVTVTHQTCSAAKWNYGSTYGNNVGELLSTLSGSGSAAAVDNWWFRTATVGSVSGLAMCFADSDATWCHKCLTFLISKYLPYKCDHSRNASVVTSGGCVVRYADAPFFGSASDSGDELVVVSSTLPTYDAAAMREARRTLLSQLAETAGEEALRFATGSQRYMVRHGGSQVMYGMAQCTRDLSASECTACLLDLLAVMYKDVSVTNSTEASVMGFSCYLTYQIDDPIYIDGMAPPLSPAPAPLPVPAVTTPTGSSSSATPPPVCKMTTVLIAALAAVTLLISSFGV